MLSKFRRHWTGVKNMYKIKQYTEKDKQRGLRAREKLGIMYAFIAWNCFGIAFYLLLNERMPTDSAERKKALFQVTGSPGNMHVYQFKGFKSKKEYDLKKEEHLLEDENQEEE